MLTFTYFSCKSTTFIKENVHGNKFIENTILRQIKVYDFERQSHILFNNVNQMHLFVNYAINYIETKTQPMN